MHLHLKIGLTKLTSALIVYDTSDTYLKLVKENAKGGQLDLDLSCCGPCMLS